ncbi:hypothetical protein RAC89_11295 [Paenibacillus sp. GD4]|uniref:hypothetical protein n=1 Tax=Paenibacillus sp. GD4 TaxID=3068890 RepID=UPI002796A75A|nr:hypothetical protein [Paenibacillus sp. GD4]MDQ1911036.1 hypothetical protein [Paenibacillus sp. GD4]
MARDNIKVPFGYEPPDPRQGERGTMWVYDSFEGYTAQELMQVLHTAEDRRFAKVVFYPLHEETLRRMDRSGAAEPMYRRVQLLEALLDESDTDIDWVIENFEAKRKKYTPVDFAFRFLQEKYKGPHFAYVTQQMANRMAGYDTFEEWIKRIRLFIAEDGTGAGSGGLHPKLQEYEHRWERVLVRV